MATVIPGSPPRGPSPGLIAVVSLLVVGMLLGAGLVAARHLGDAESAGQPTHAWQACWDGTRATVGQCPPLEGESGLRWAFPAAPQFTDCKPAQTQGIGELETWECSWSDLNATVFLSRWNTTTSTGAYFDNSLGKPVPAPLASGPASGWVWESLTPQGGGGPGYAFAYANFPYSFLVLGEQSARDQAAARLFPRPISQLEDLL